MDLVISGPAEGSVAREVVQEVWADRPDALVGGAAAEFLDQQAAPGCRSRWGCSPSWCSGC